jgi:hypothetical protein
MWIAKKVYVPGMEYVPLQKSHGLRYMEPVKPRAAIPFYSTARGERKANISLQFSSGTAKELPLPESGWQERSAVGARSLPRSSSRM